MTLNGGVEQLRLGLASTFTNERSGDLRFASGQIAPQSTAFELIKDDGQHHAGVLH